MSEEIDLAGIKVPKADWDATPASVRVAVSTLINLFNARLIQLETENQSLRERVAHLEEQLKQTSQNSSKPPSKDGFSKPVKPVRPKRKPNKLEQIPRQGQELYPSETCDGIYEQIPPVCHACGTALRGEDESPYRHQVIEVPPIAPTVLEYRLHQLECEQCGAKTRATLPVGVSHGGYGERLTAIVALLSSEYRQSHRMVQGLMATLLGVRLSRGSVNRLRQEMSEALCPATTEAKHYIQSQAVIHSDETSFRQGNQDKLNPHKTKGWIWTLVTPLVCFFEVVLSRSGATAQALIGKDFKGIVVSDRYSSYNWIELTQRQVCWAHIKRDFTAIAERSGVSKEIGEALLFRERRLFRWWHRVRDGTLSREAFKALVEPLREGLKRELEAAASLPIGDKEKTPLAKTVRTCRQLLKVESALWTFVDIPGVEPTNNHAERALRPAVIWRRTSFGAQSKAGSLFVSRMLTVVTSLKAQHRDVLAFLTQSCCAARSGLTPPSLILQSQVPDEINLAA
jgi:transposase